MAPHTPESKREHFVFLDGLRGVAALCVGWLHACDLMSLTFMPHNASLAVDFFFCLSGFVIAYAYDDRLAATMSPREFVVRRLVRLYPMIAIGVVTGGTVMVANALILHTGDTEKRFFYTISALVLFPLGLVYGRQAYPVNNPIWSLFFELVANFVYGTGANALRFVSLARLVGILALLLAIVLWISNGLDEIGFGDFRSFGFGFVRVGYPFFAGVLIFRSGLFARLPSAAAGSCRGGSICLPDVEHGREQRPGGDRRGDFGRTRTRRVRSQRTGRCPHLDLSGQTVLSVLRPAPADLARRCPATHYWDGWVDLGFAWYHSRRRGGPCGVAFLRRASKTLATEKGVPNRE